MLEGIRGCVRECMRVYERVLEGVLVGPGGVAVRLCE